MDKASELTTLFTSSGATNVYGPNFTFEDISKVEKNCLKKQWMMRRKGGYVG